MKPTEIDQELNAIWKLVTLARYEAAYQRAKKLYQAYPDHHQVAYRYAVCLGDRTGEDRSKKAKINHKNAAKILRRLIYRIRVFEPNRRGIVLNEYYWFSKQPKKQYRLGIKDVKNGIQSGFYSMGVGAWCVAREYASAGKLRLANKWAKEASNSWEKYFKYKSDYYNAWAWYAKSQGFLYGEKAMEKALKVAQKLSKQSRDYIEFEEIREEFRSLELR